MASECAQTQKEQQEARRPHRAPVQEGGEGENGRLSGEEAEGPVRPNTEPAPSQNWKPAEKREQK